MGNIKLFGQGCALGIWARGIWFSSQHKRNICSLRQFWKSSLIECLISSRLCLILWFKNWFLHPLPFCPDFGQFFCPFHWQILSRLLSCSNLNASIFPPGAEGGKAASVWEPFNLLASLVTICFPKNQNNPLLLLFNVIWETNRLQNPTFCQTEMFFCFFKCAFECDLKMNYIVRYNRAPIFTESKPRNTARTDETTVRVPEFNF